MQARTSLPRQKPNLILTSFPTMVNKSVGCLFCDMVGSVSTVNQHIKSFHKSASTERKSRLGKYHHLGISEAFDYLVKDQRKLVQLVSAERLSVLMAFASQATVPLGCDAAVQEWTTREYTLHGADWWDRQVDIAVEKFLSSAHDEDVLEAHVKKVIGESIENATYERVPVGRNQSREPPARPRRGGLFSIAGGAGSTLNMQGDKSTQRNQSAANQIAQGDSIGQNRDIILVDDDDDEDDEDELYAPPPPKRLVAKQRGAGTMPVRSVSSSASSTTQRQPEPAAAPRRVVSDTVHYSYGPPSITTSNVVPFLTLNVNDVYNHVRTIPIDFDTTLDEAIALAVKLAPHWLRRVHLEFCFEDLDSGKWPESRWDQVMQDAQRDELVVALRLVPME